MLTLLNARTIIDGSLLRAEQLNLNVSVAVCDTTGRLIALNQMDRSVGWEADRSSMGKAVAAACTGQPSDRLFDYLSTGGPPGCPVINNVVPPRGERGGLPVVEAGIVQGGCGVSGALRPELDEECARAGIAALNAAAVEPALTGNGDRFAPRFHEEPRGLMAHHVRDGEG